MQHKDLLDDSRHLLVVSGKLQWRGEFVNFELYHNVLQGLRLCLAAVAGIRQHLEHGSVSHRDDCGADNGCPPRPVMILTHAPIISVRIGARAA